MSTAIYFVKHAFSYRCLQEERVYATKAKHSPLIGSYFAVLTTIRLDQQWGITSRWTALPSTITISWRSLFYFPVPVLHNFKHVFCETHFCPLHPSWIKSFNCRNFRMDFRWNTFLSTSPFLNKIVQLLRFSHGFSLTFQSFFFLLALKLNKKFINQGGTGAWTRDPSGSAVKGLLINNVNKDHYLYILITCWLQPRIQALMGDEWSTSFPKKWSNMPPKYFFIVFWKILHFSKKIIKQYSTFNLW